MSTFEQFYNTTIDSLHRYVAFRLYRSPEVMDIVQMAYVKVYERFAIYSSNEHAERSLYTIARNLIIDVMRGNSRKSFTVLETDTLGDRNLAPDVTYESKERADELQQALQSLSPDDSEIVVLRSLEFGSYEHIAKIMNMRVDAVRKRHSRALQKLKDWYESHRATSAESLGTRY